MYFIEAFQPDVFESLCDTVSSVGHASKRIRKSVDRTLQFLDMSLQKREENEVRKMFYFRLFTCPCFLCVCAFMS